MSKDELTTADIISKFDSIDEYRTHVMMLALVTILIIFLSFIKILSFMRTFPAFGQLVFLVNTAIMNMRNFSYFFAMWIVLFSFVFTLSGAKFSADGYGGLGWYGVQLINTFNNSIANISNPETSFWHDEGTLSVSSIIMIVTIWLMWFINIFICCIVLLNFLIANISASYE